MKNPLYTLKKSTETISFSEGSLHEVKHFLLPELLGGWYTYPLVPPTEFNSNCTNLETQHLTLVLQDDSQ